MQGYSQSRLLPSALLLLLLAGEINCAVLNKSQKDAVATAAGGNENDGSYSADTSGGYVADNSGQYVEDNAGAYQPTGDEGKWLADGLGVYHDDLMWRYVRDNSGVWTQDTSGNYDPALEAQGAYHPDATGVYQADNSGAYSKEYEKVSGR